MKLPGRIFIRTTSPRAAPAAAAVGGDARYYLRITGIVAAGMLFGGGVELLLPPAQPLAWLGYALAYGAGGSRIARDGWHTWRSARRLSIDVLMIVAALGAALVGSAFEGSVLIFLFSLSNALESHALGRTRIAIERLIALRPDEATLAAADGSAADTIAVAALRPGHRILVRPGDRLAADGRVLSGRSSVDQSAITGESVPLEREAGHDVFAGSINLGGVLVVEVTREPDDTVLARIVALVEEARERRAPAQHFIDRFAHPYTLLVLGATLLLATLPPVFFDAEWRVAFYRAMTLLVVASPCALVISTPAAILSGIANGARHGVLFKGGAYLDLAGTIDVVAFDKTGTLTEGRPRLLDVVTTDDLADELGAARAGRTGDADARAAALLRLSAALERDSEHHLARAVVDAARDRGIHAPMAAAFEAIPGHGVSGTVDGSMAWIGNEAMAARMDARVPLALRGWVAEQTSRARSVVYAGHHGVVLGALAFGDALKPLAAATIRHLKKEGVRWITILSGDHPDAVRAIAAQLGADEVRAGLLPHEKVTAVRELAAASRGVAMVGDGVNDAPAMANATLGIAMGAAGTDVAIETADVVLMGDAVERVDYVLHLGRRARRVVRQNVAFSIGWMALLIVISLTVGIPLALAVVAHEGSTLLVAMNGLRLLAGSPHEP
jgi:Zn2+/Cd2+-exporting ATPase